MIITLVILAVFITIPTPAFAYMDLGTGTLILQGIIAAAVGGFVGIKLYWQKINEFFRKKLNPDTGNKSDPS